MRAGLAGRALWVLVGVAACERYVAVGREDAVVLGGSSPQGGAPPGGERGEGGGGVGGDASGGDASGQSPWSADHEVGTFEQWLGDGEGHRYEEGSGELALSTDRAHSGSYSYTASIRADDGELHQAMLGRDAWLPEGRYGAWYFLPEPPRADYWVLMKLSNGAEVNRFDIDLEVPEGEQPYLRLYEHPQGWISERSPVPFPVGRWVHLEAAYRSTPEADGRLVVFQDGEPVIDTGPRPTARDALVTFYCGSASRFVAPAPYRLFIDDAHLEPSPLPP